MNVSLKISTAALIVATFAGCSFNPIGESTFDCNRKEHPSEYCRSFKALEKSTNGPLPESRFDKEFKMSDYDRANGIAPDSETDTRARDDKPRALAVLPHQRITPVGEPIAGMPVRKAPVVQRVFIKRFVDENDNLQDDVVVYREVKSARWTGFEANGETAHAPSAYPHRAKENYAVAANNDEPSPQQPNLAQPGSDTDGAAGSAIPPADQSGGANVPKLER
jgi:conjugal transfer pilus assembly protein TraV